MTGEESTFRERPKIISEWSQYAKKKELLIDKKIDLGTVYKWSVDMVLLRLVTKGKITLEELFDRDIDFGKVIENVKINDPDV